MDTIPYLTYVQKTKSKLYIFLKYGKKCKLKDKSIKRGYQICQLYKSEVIFAKSHYERTLFSEAIIVSLQILNSKKFEILAQ